MQVLGTTKFRDAVRHGVAAQVFPNAHATSSDLPSAGDRKESH